jgi:fluoride ion exporter CrcB/FEX
MVVMLDGSGTELGSQVVPALFGYLVGACCAVTSFIFGRHVYDWLKDSRSQVTELGTSGSEPGTSVHVIHKAASMDSTASNVSRAAYCFWRQAVVILGIDVAPFLLCIGLAVAFGVADGVLGIPYYRRMWMIIIVSPFGALLRWRMSRWNNLKLGWKQLAWIPWGTFLANVSAAVISILAEATEARFNPRDHVNYIWWSSALIAIEAGFAGSLSTVSTLVKEMFDLASKNPSRAYVYFLLTVLCSMLLSLAVYMPMMRIG